MTPQARDEASESALPDAQIVTVADWLRDIGYGIDYSAPDHPLPEFLRRPLAESWHRREAVDFPEVNETVDDYLQLLDDEGAW